MEKTVNDFSLSLFLWQILVIILLAVIIFYIVKLYKKIVKYLDNNK